MRIVKGKIRDEAYLSHIHNSGCIVCGTMPVHAHHLLRLESIGEYRGTALKNGDNWAVPLCPPHHDDLHEFGREEVWLALHGVDAIEWAKVSWREYNERQT